MPIVELRLILLLLLLLLLLLKSGKFYSPLPTKVNVLKGGGGGGGRRRRSGRSCRHCRRRASMCLIIARARERNHIGN